MSAISSPIKVGINILNHRVVLAPLTRFRATSDAVPTDLQVDYYEQRASEGGLLITEATAIHRLAGGYPRAPGIYTQEQINAWKKVTDAVHKKGGYQFVQLWHTGRAASSTTNTNGERIVGPSPIAISGDNMFGEPYEVPHELTIEEIHVITQQYLQASLNAIEAGFDGVEIHSANGYLLDQFINSSSNHRTDIYGGPVENRARFSFEVIQAIVDAIGPERVGIRLSPDNSFQDVYDDDVLGTWSYITTELQSRFPGLAYLHFVQPRTEVHKTDRLVSPMDTLEPYRQLWKGPFITASGYSNSTQDAVDLAEKTGNLIAFGRVFIANPDFPERLRNGWELNKYDRSTFYTHGPEGYIDYPFHEQQK